MIKTLHKKLTLLYGISTGFILTCVVIGIALINTRDLQKQEVEALQNHLLNITGMIQGQNEISFSWLAQMEADNQLIIHIEDNASPLLYRGSWQPPANRAYLVQQAKEIALSEGVNTQLPPVSSGAIRSSIFLLTGDAGEIYNSTVVVLQGNNGFKSLVLIATAESFFHALQKSLPFFLLNVLGILALFFVSWKLVGKALKPIAENQKRQTEFIASASHELRSPLAVIKAAAGNLLLTEDSHVFPIRIILQEVDRMSRLINDMLLLASADAKTWSLDLAAVDVDSLLIDTYEGFLPVCRENAIALKMELADDEFPQIFGDIQRLKQILAILMDNALAYSPEKSEIILRGFQKENRIFIEVEDQGPGISDEDKEKIFERFYRIDKSRKDKKHFGLGLSIAKELVALHGGKISVRDGRNGGACFVVVLKG